MGELKSRDVEGGGGEIERNFLYIFIHKYHKHQNILKRPSLFRKLYKKSCILKSKRSRRSNQQKNGTVLNFTLIDSQKHLILDKPCMGAAPVRI